MTLLLALLLAQPPAVSALDHVLRLAGRFSVAHACPVGPREALTNGHVIDPRPFDASVATLPYAWSDGRGNEGFVVPSRLERARDLASVEPLRAADAFPYWFPIAERRPAAGDRVWLLGYDWKNRKAALGDDVIEARVTRVVALHVIYVPAGNPGSSGSCVLNDAGEVVGINEGAFSTDDGNAGFAVGVWGGLRELPK